MAIDGTPRHILVVADGDVSAREELDAAWPGWADGASAVVAADGGFARSAALGLRPDVLVGDLDSLAPDGVAEAEASGARIVRRPTDKDESDAELALLEAVEMGATRITVLGAFGGPASTTPSANPGCSRTRPWRPSTSCCSTPAPAPACSRPRDELASPSRSHCPDASAPSSRCSRSAAMRAASPPTACGIPSATSRSASVLPAASPTSGWRSTRRWTCDRAGS
ncbi:MAG: hypothetical protein U0838_07550 [Chloroflexota bacterium]